VRAQRGSSTHEDGMTLVELIVAMGILSIMLAISMVAVSGMTKSTVRAQAVTNSTDQLRTVFQRLDKEVRYASAINAPGTAGGSIYLEYLVDASAANGEAQCVQWRYVTDTAELQRRVWSPHSGSPSTWNTLVTGLRNDLSKSEQQPFELIRAGNYNGKVYSKQQLTVYLDAGMGDSEDPRGGQLSTTLVALNSSSTSPTTVCLNAGADRS
jgi:prepilin-type N-terminal cleavage/methylation domain-containing protein